MKRGIIGKNVFLFLFIFSMLVGCVFGATVSSSSNPSSVSFGCEITHEDHTLKDLTYTADWYGFGDNERGCFLSSDPYTFSTSTINNGYYSSGQDSCYNVHCGIVICTNDFTNFAASKVYVDESYFGLTSFSMTASCSDSDKDGISSPADCNDNDASIYPGANETCNGVDQNCDGVADQDLYGKLMIDESLCISQEPTPVYDSQYSISPSTSYKAATAENYPDMVLNGNQIFDLSSKTYVPYTFAWVSSFASSGQWQWLNCSAETNTSKTIPTVISNQGAVNITTQECAQAQTTEQKEMTLYYYADNVDATTNICTTTCSLGTAPVPTTGGGHLPASHYCTADYKTSISLLRSGTALRSYSGAITLSPSQTGYTAKSFNFETQLDIQKGDVLRIEEEGCASGGAYRPPSTFEYTFTEAVRLEPSLWNFNRYYTSSTASQFYYGVTTWNSTISGIKYSVAGISAEQNCTNVTKEMPLPNSSCCPSYMCWNGTSCVAGTSFSQLGTTDPSKLSYLGDISNMFICIINDTTNVADWSYGFEKNSQYNETKGYCGLQTQCLYYKDANHSTCVNSMNVSPTATDDLFCYDGNWTTKTNVLYNILKNSFITNDDYLISCAKYNSLNPECVLVYNDTLALAAMDYTETGTVASFLKNYKLKGSCACTIDDCTFEICDVNISGTVIPKKPNFSVYHSVKNKIFIFTNTNVLPQLTITDYATDIKPNRIFYSKNALTALSGPTFREVLATGRLGTLKQQTNLLFADATNIYAQDILNKITGQTQTDLGANNDYPGEDIELFNNPYYTDAERFGDYLMKASQGVSLSELKQQLNNAKSSYNTYKNCLIYNDTYHRSIYPAYFYLLAPQYLPKNIQTLPTNHREEGCCDYTGCWDTATCISGFLETSPLSNTPANENKFRYGYGNKTQYACIQNLDWASVYHKSNGDRTSNGYCLYENQCWVNDEIGCINDTQYSGDYYCNNGTYSTRSALIAATLLNATVDLSQGNYVLYCDNLTNAINEVWPGFNNIDDKVSGFCVLKYTSSSSGKDKTVIGFGANQDIFSEVISNINAENTYANTAPYSVNLSCTGNFANDGLYYVCNNKNQLWYNNKTNSFIVTRYDVNLGNQPFIYDVIDFILHPILGFINIFYDTGEQQYFLLNNELTPEKIYIYKNGVKEIYSVVGFRNDEKVLLSEYKNFDSDLCKTFGLQSQYCEYDSSPAVRKHTLEIIDSNKIDAYWTDISARSRPQDISQGYMWVQDYSNAVWRLYPGWNFVGMSCDLANKDISAALTPYLSSDKIVKIQQFAGPYSGYVVYDLNYPQYNTLSTLEPGKGYFVLVNANSLPITVRFSCQSPIDFSIPLQKGWNMIAVNKEIPMSQMPCTPDNITTYGPYPLDDEQLKILAERSFSPAQFESNNMTPWAAYYVRCTDSETVWNIPK